MRRWLSFAMFLSVVLTVFGSLHYYLYSRLDTWIHPGGWLLPLAMGALAVSPVAARLSERVSRFVYVPLWWLAATWMGVAFYLLVFLSSGHLVETAIHVAGAWPVGGTSRFTVGGGVLLTAVASIVGLVFGERQPCVTELDVALPGLPEEAEGLTVVQISDVHVGALVGERKVRRLVEQINAMSPDLVLITGDLVDERPDKLRACGKVLAGLKARAGVFSITGNHEFYSGPGAAIAWMKRAGIRVLDNEVVEPVPGLQLAGFHDPTGIEWDDRRFRATPTDIEETLARRDEGKPTIALYHQPLLVDRFARAGVNLLLCGHTHGGQLWPFRHLTALRYRYTQGLYEESGMRMYVCRGTGTWGPPMRLPQPAEIVRIRLRRSP